MATATFLDTLEPLLGAVKPYMVSLAIIVARPMGVLIVFPVFARAELGRMVRMGFAIVMVLPAFPALHAARLAASAELAGEAGAFSGAILLVVIGAKEFAVGFLLALALSVPFWAIQMAGELIDQQRGVTISDMQDPATHGQASATNTLLGMTAITVFVTAGGMTIAIGALYQSYLVWPLETMLPTLSLQGFLRWGVLLDHIFRFALVVAGPFLVIFLVSDLSVALIERFTAKISAYALAPLVKNLVFGLILSVYAAFALTYLRDELAHTREAPEILRQLIVPDG